MKHRCLLLLSVSIIIITLPVLKFMLAGFSILDPESSLEDGGKVALSLCEDATYHIPMQLVQCKVKQN